MGPDRLTVAATALTAFAIGSFPRPDFDYWWHLAVGRYIVQTRQWPSPDPFSFTAYGQPWTAHEWLIEAVMYGLYSAFGHSGPRAFFALCFAATMAIAFLALRRAGVRASVAAVLTLVLMLACVSFAGPRPHLLSLLLFAITWAVVQRWQVRRDRWVWALPVLFLVWANLHAGFFPGLAIPVLLLIGDVAERLAWREHEELGARDRRRLLLALALSLVALFCTPNGWHVPAYPFTAIGLDEVQAIGEWKPTDIHARGSWPFFGLAGLYLLLVILRRPRLPAFDLMAAGLFIFGGIWVVRVVPFASIALIMLIARVLPLSHESVTRWPLSARRAALTPPPARTALPTRPLPRWAEVVGLLPLVIAAIGVLAGYGNDYGRQGSAATLDGALTAIRADGLRTPLLNQYNYGGYLIWALAPERKVFIDGRSHDLYTHGSLFADYLAMEEVRPNVDSLLEQYAIETVLYPQGALLPRYLLAKGTWVTTYEDEATIVLRRR